MAVKVNVRILNNGRRNLNLLITGQGDGQGQVTNLKIMDASVFVPADTRPPRVDKIVSDIGYGIVTLLWDAATPQPFTILGGTGQTFDHKAVGGITVPAIEGANGNILLSTTGFEAGSSFTIKLDIVK